jgi:hypothetical protein
VKISQCWLGAVLFVLVAGSAVGVEQSTSSDVENFCLTVRQNFKYWDSDSDGVLTMDELSEGIENPNVRGDAAAALAAIRVRQRHLLKTNPQTRNFALSQVLVDSAAFDPVAVKDLATYFATFQKKLRREARQLFSTGMPHLESIRQGKSGDCFFVSTVGGLVNANPQAIVQMIAENPDGSYAVNFPRRPPEVVAPPTDGEIAVYSDAGGDGIWFHVLEKAYSQIQARIRNRDDIEPLDAVSRGGSSSRAVVFLTGHAARTYHFRTSEDVDLGSVVANAMSEHRIVEANARGHACTVIGFDPQSREITIWNPWGTDAFYKTVGRRLDNGVFTMPLPELKQRFVSFGVEERRLADSPDDVDVHNRRRHRRR